MRHLKRTSTPYGQAQPFTISPLGVARTAVAFDSPPSERPPARRRESWRHYQRRMRQNDRRHAIRRRWMWLAIPPLVALVLWVVANRLPDTAPRTVTPEAASPPTPPVETLLGKADVQNLLETTPVEKILAGPFEVRFGDRRLRVESTIDPDLQHFLQSQLYRRTSRYIAIVVMDARSGRVLALVDFAREGFNARPSLSNQFPAASLFKIVTAAAAIEKCGYTGSTPLAYNGASHTLYKSQLKNVSNRYTRHTTLKKAFAGSVNPVFGKIGRHCLGAEKLRQYADRFGFDRSIAFELELPPSSTRVTEAPYQWAEIASGFNQETVISPLHGAVLAAVAPAEGRLVEPTIIHRVVDQEGRLLYRSRAGTPRTAVSPATARELTGMMRRTVSHGTARKIFRRRNKDKVLSRLTIGGKTGSIDTPDHKARYDWFAGFADGPDPNDAIAVSVLVAHEKYIGRRAGEYARRAAREYFRQRFERQSKDGGRAQGTASAPLP